MPSPIGFIFAATGHRYVTLARRSARQLRQVMPGAVIDFFTDEPLDDPIFDRVHMLSKSGPRPKMEALRRSRFAKTLYLDADIIVLHPVWDCFALLDRFDFVAAHENYRNSPSSQIHWRGTIPPTFPEVNSGVVGLRKSPGTEKLMSDWEKEFTDSDLNWDQPVLRRLLYDSDLSLGILPIEYNLMHTNLIARLGRQMAAPRILHVTRLHGEDVDQGNPQEPLDYQVWVRGKNKQRLDLLEQRDTTLALSAQRNFARPKAPSSGGSVAESLKRAWHRIMGKGEE